MLQPIVTIKNLIKTRPEGRGYELLIPSLEIRQGDFMALLGQSGSGKSTALDILALILRPDSCAEFSIATNNQNSGSPFDVWAAWQGKSLDALADIRAVSFGYVLQIGGLLPFLNVKDNILLARRTVGLPGDGPLHDLAGVLGIGHLLGKSINQISVGERQRVAIARALIHEPQLVLADEPTSALDPVTAKDVLGLLISLTQQHKAALIIASHDWHAVRRAGFRELTIQVDMGASYSQDATTTMPPIKAVLTEQAQNFEEADK